MHTLWSRMVSTFGKDTQSLSKMQQSLLEQRISWIESMNKLDSAKKILEVFMSGHQIVSLRELARECGFQRASSRDFKDGFNFLTERKVIKLQQSGWSSEKRNAGDAHPKTAMLVGDIFKVDSSEANIGFTVDLDKLDLVGLANSDRGSTQVSLIKKELSDSMKQKYRDCQDCNSKPVVLITMEQIGVCGKHWEYLAHSDITW